MSGVRIRDWLRGRRPRLAFWGAALGTAGFWTLLIWAVHRESPRTLISFHGLLHAAIASRFLEPRTAAFPPENPFFAGEPVAYYWFFHFVAAQLARLVGWDAFHAMEALILGATGALMVMAVGLGRTLFHSTSAGVLMGYLVVAGTNPSGVVFAGLRFLRRGAEIFRDDPNYLWGVVHPMYAWIRYNDPGGLFGPLLNFFLNMTSRPVALASLMAVVLCLKQTLRSRRISPLLWLGSASALSTALSPIMGMAAGGALLAGLAVSRVTARRPVETSPLASRDAGSATAAGAAILAGILLAAPTYYHLLLGPSASQVDITLLSVSGLLSLASVLSSIAVLAILAVIGLRRASAAQRRFLLSLLVAAALLVPASAAFRLPPGNESNFFHAAVVLLSVPAAGSILRPGTTAESRSASLGRAAVILLVFLPTTLLLLSAYVQRPALPVAFEGRRSVRLPEDSGLARFYEWVQSETSPEAVFIIDPRQRIAMCGNVAELPALTGRTLFTEQRRHYLVAPYPDAGRRVDLAERLLSGGEPTASDRAYLEALGRPLYLASYLPGDASLMARLRRLHGPPLFENGAVSVFRGPVSTSTGPRPAPAARGDA